MTNDKTTNANWILKSSKDGQSYDMVLNGFCSMLWADDSPAAAELRSEVIADARTLAASFGRIGRPATVTIYSDEGHSLETVQS
jgi:hypothetical protein